MINCVSDNSVKLFISMAQQKIQ